MDLTVCAVHYHFNLTRETQTERIMRAMDNPHFNILAHPSGRLIHRREPYDVDMERLMRAAKERGCFMELDSQPDRLDLIDIHCKLAKDLGLKVSISTDAHSTADLNYHALGDRPGPPGLAGGRRRPQHPPLAGVEEVAEENLRWGEFWVAQASSLCLYRERLTRQPSSTISSWCLERPFIAFADC